MTKQELLIKIFTQSEYATDCARHVLAVDAITSELNPSVITEDINLDYIVLCPQSSSVKFKGMGADVKYPYGYDTKYINIFEIEGELYAELPANVKLRKDVI